MTSTIETIINDPILRSFFIGLFVFAILMLIGNYVFGKTKYKVLSSDSYRAIKGNQVKYDIEGWRWSLIPVESDFRFRVRRVGGDASEGSETALSSAQAYGRTAELALDNFKLLVRNALQNGQNQSESYGHARVTRLRKSKD